MGKEYVWYVCYGSNMLRERFEIYLKGGYCKYNGQTYVEHCTDPTPPTDVKPYKIQHHNMYYGNQSERWGGRSVSFLDSDISKDGFAWGRAYRITEEQFEDIWKLEGKGKNWYHYKLELPSFRDGEKVYTFTNEDADARKKEFSDVSEAYQTVIKLGLKETYPEMTEQAIKEYIEKTIQNSQ